MQRPFLRCVHAVLGLAVLGVACAGDPAAPPRAIAPPTRIPDPVAPTALPAGQPVAITALSSDLRRAVADDAARRFGVLARDVVLSDAEQVTWGDSSLGCPEPGQMYAQALVPGFRVVANTTQGKLVYHTDEGRRVASCGSRHRPQPSQPQTPSKPVEPRTGPPPATPDR